MHISNTATLDKCSNERMSSNVLTAVTLPVDKETDDKETDDKETDDKETDDKEIDDKDTDDKDTDDKDTDDKDTDDGKGDIFQEFKNFMQNILTHKISEKNLVNLIIEYCPTPFALLWERETFTPNSDANIVCSSISELIENHSRKNTQWNSGACILIDWGWSPSYLTAEKYKISKILSQIEESRLNDENPDYCGEKYSDKNKHCCITYNLDYITLSYGSIWNSSDKLIKVYIHPTLKDMNLARNFIQNEVLIASQHLELP